MTLDRELQRVMPRAISLARRMHAHPELALQEHRAAAWLGRYLEAAGFSLSTGTAGLPTAFVARRVGGPGPAIGLVAEYDALPGIGHGCGHNLMGSSSAAAAVVASRVLGATFPGEIRVIGTPAEETRHAKVDLIAAGVFEDVDAALQIHPNDVSSSEIGLLAIADREVRFHGRAAHPVGAPWLGRSALDALIQLFLSVSQWRLHGRPGDSIHGVITQGGEAPNLVPAETAARFLIRSARDEDLDELLARFERMAQAAALATECGVDVIEGSANRCRTMWNNPVLAEVWRRHLVDGGGADGPRPPALGSSDMGNVSQVVPTIHPYLAVGAPGTALHTVEFARQCVGPTADAALRLAVRTLAACVLELINDPSIVRDAHAAFGRGASGASDGGSNGQRGGSPVRR
jgi:amidohydrolase